MLKLEFKKHVFVSTIVAIGIMSFILFGASVEKDNGLNKGHDAKTILVSIGHIVIRVFLADNPYYRELGLGGRAFIFRDEGMLFAFDTLDRYGFWMKDMKFPIDIVWLQEMQVESHKDTPPNANERHRLVVVDIKEKISPATFPEVFTPKAPAKYVLEIPAGFSEENGLKIGDTVSF